MISFSQLNEQIYVDRVLSESFLSEAKTYTRPPEEVKELKDMEREAKKEQREAETALEKAKVEQERQKRLKDQYNKRLDKEIKEIERDDNLSAREQELEIEKAKLANTLKLKELDEIADKRKDEIERLKFIQQTKKDQAEEKDKLIQRKLDIQKADAERKLAREQRRAEMSFDDLFKGAAVGTVEGLGAAVSYSTKALFSFVKQNPMAAAGVTTAIVLDQFLFNNKIMRGMPLVGGGLIPNFVGFILRQLSGFGSSVGASAAWSALSALATPIAILAAAGIGLYGAYRLIRVLLDLGEAKALQIAKRLETASEDEKEEILRKELKVNTRRLKKQRA